MKMDGAPAEGSAPARPAGRRKKGFIWEIKTHWMLYLFTLPALAYLLVFKYLPMVGIVIAFQKFNPIKGLFGSELIGFSNFAFFFRGSKWVQVTFNTFYLNALFHASGTVVSVLIAIMMTELGKTLYVRISQSVMILPNFISWIVVAMFSIAFIGSNGVINEFIMKTGGEPIPFYNRADIWPLIFVIIRIWKGAGFGAVIYMATITGIDPEMNEAALIDGANRLKRIFFITLPMLKDVVILVTLINISWIFYGDFAMIYAFIGDNASLFETTDVVDTYVFRTLRETTNFGRTAAVGLYQSVIGFIIVVTSNFFVKRLNPESAIF